MQPAHSTQQTAGRMQAVFQQQQHRLSLLAAA
jgi:hypothetical protein